MRNVRGLGKECNIYNNIYNIEEMAWSWRGQRGRVVEEGQGYLDAAVEKMNEVLK